MKIEQATEYERYVDPDNCWKPMKHDDKAKLVKISLGDEFIILKADAFFSHHDRDVSQWTEKIVIVQSLHRSLKK